MYIKTSQFFFIYLNECNRIKLIMLQSCVFEKSKSRCISFFSPFAKYKINNSATRVGEIERHVCKINIERKYGFRCKDA